MNSNFDKILSQANTWQPFLEKLRNIFQELDLAYEKTAVKCEFHCQGCEDSCCRTRFYHHTVLEFLFISKGLRTLAPQERQQIVKQATQVCQVYAEKDQTGDSIRIMCPLIEDNQCRLYGYRPMICRAHGIPHELHHPVKGVLTGPGCHIFTELSRNNDDLRFDRTPFYTAIAQLEMQLRESIQIQGKIRMTIADMVVFANRERPS